MVELCCCCCRLGVRRLSLLWWMMTTSAILALHGCLCSALVANNNHQNVQPTTTQPQQKLAISTDRYVLHWDHLLLEEHRETIQQLRQRRSQWSPQRLEAFGLAILDAFAEPESEILGEKTVRIVSSRRMSSFSAAPISKSQQRPWKDVFGKGDILEMTSLGLEGGSSSFSSPKGRRKRSSSTKASTTFAPRECLIMEVGDDWMVVGVGPTWPRGLWENRKHPQGYRVRMDRQMGSTAPLQAQRTALQRLRASLSSSWSLPSQVSAGRSVGSAVQVLAKLWANETIATASFEQDTDELSNPLTCETEREAGKIPSYLRAAFLNDSTEDHDESMLDIVVQNALERATATHDAFLEDKAHKRLCWTANESQQSAILWALQRRISLIRGPPGTGKTKTAALLIATALELEQQRVIIAQRKKKKSKDPILPTQLQQSIRVLAVTHSNGAADVLLEALLEMGVPAVRSGRPASVSPQVQHRSVIALAEKLPHIKEMRRQIMQQSVKANSFASNTRNTLDSTAGAQWQLKKGLEDAQSMLLQSASVVVTSCIGAHQLSELQTEKGCLFPLVVLDEAAQCTEPALVCALVAAQAQQVVLVGDTQQLPPTVTSSSKILRKSLGVSPMERLENAGVEQHTLRVQYRMPPALLQHPSKYFYNGIVQSMARDDNDPCPIPPKGFAWPSPTNEPLAFVQVGNGDSEVVHTMGGRSNPTEAKLVAKIVYDLLQGGDVSAATDIAILTPYSKQVQAIRSALEDISLRMHRTVEAPASLLQSSRGSPAMSIRNIPVGTIDSFQGQETDVIVFSAVRSNSMSELGFLRDRRRLCVAITRARKGLILLGDLTVLTTCRHWQALIESCRDRGCFVPAESLLLTSDSDNEDDDGVAALLDGVMQDQLQQGTMDILGSITHDDSLYGFFSSSTNTSDIESLL